MSKKLKLSPDIVEGIKGNLKYQYESDQITLKEYIELLKELEEGEL